MSAQANGPPIQFLVRMSEQTRKHVKELHQEAAQRGAGKAFLDALKQIILRLRQDPLTFGEHLYTLAALGLKVQQAAIIPLVVDYAVYEEKSLVFIRGFKTLSQ